MIDHPAQDVPIKVTGNNDNAEFKQRKDGCITNNVKAVAIFK